MNKFKIFTKTKKYHFTKVDTLLALMFLLILIYWTISSFTDENQLTFFKELILGCVVIAIFILFLLKLTFFLRKKPIIGKFDGYLELYSDKIIAGNKTFLIDSIKKIEINGGDYYGQLEISGYVDPDGSVKNGTTNFIEIILHNNEKFKYNFQQVFEHDILNVKDTLIEYSKQGKLHFLNLIDILNISDYNEIQEFKKNFIQYR
ncbi:hypothetical protein [Flavobacterium sp. UBA6195]|uniref:hypothetical protein n=1 Tax=Flavobacterium sp. UBA6195 TaxID=1946554 RepID=UPI0025BDA46E|nr:hypothetical protein [Flavobacterium sp. UBA6195]